MEEDAAGHDPPDALWREAFRQASVGLAVTDDRGTTLSVNAHLAGMVGPACAEVVGVAVRSRLALLGDEPVVVPLDERVAARVEPITLTSYDGQQRRFFLVHVLPPLATDPLTGLVARDRLMAELVRLLGRREGRPVELVVLDVDRFKEVNDRHGHVVGDEVLMSVADRLLATVRPEDVVCRWGGDEFIVLLDDPAEGVSERVCARIGEALQQPLQTRAGTVTVSLSCGLVRAEHGEEPAEVLERADRQMYASKHDRRRASEGDEAIHAEERTRRNRERTAELTQMVTAVRGRVARAREEMGRGPFP